MKKISVLFFLVVLFFASCAVEHIKKNLEFESTGTLTVGNTWGTVTSSYVVVKDTPLKNGITVGHLRKGDIISIFGRRTINDTNKAVVWLHLENGWIPDSYCTEYSLLAKAKTKANELLK